MQQEINVPALFAAHSECKVFNKIDGRLYDEIVNIEFYNKRLCLYINSDKASWRPLESCLLALKPLSAIIDEHLEMIARMAFAPYSTEIGDVLKIEHELFEDGNRECKIWFKKLKTYFCLDVNHVAFIFVKEDDEVETVGSQVAIIDTLRLLGYDCGHMHIPSLIEDGRYAVDINTLNK